jgi:hypothetical protein
MAANGDLYQVIDRQRLQGQRVDNVYFYKRNAAVITGSVAEAVADAFDGQVIPGITPVQAPALVHESIIVTNLYDPPDTFTKAVSHPGTWDGPDDSPPFDAFGFRLIQDNGAIRNGSKRIAGLKENQQSGGVVGGGAVAAALLVAGAAMVAGIDVGIISNALVPIVIKRILDGGEYRLPTNSGEAVIGNIVDALFNVDVTSQVSRKIGRGA